MDISPLYELRTRLKTAIIAGTNLLSEDFRLKRAVEAIQPLLSASPVFAKIGQLTTMLLSPEKGEKEGLLLDTIALLDAVLLTQGAVSVPGTVEPIQTWDYGTAVTNAPYSVVSALLDALKNSGNGRYSYVIDTYHEHKELFQDYRVKVAMVDALGASYAELAEQVADWLKEDGENIIPLLMNGFDPKGKKEMVRRVQILDAVAKGKVNDFYWKQLETAEKDVRYALIYALRHCPENTARLMEMTKTEKGTSKKAAYYALACQDSEEIKEFFQGLMEKKPEDVVKYLEVSHTEWASEFVAKKFKELLVPWANSSANVDVSKEDKKKLLAIDVYMDAILNKSGKEVEECYRKAFEVGTCLDKARASAKATYGAGLQSMMCGRLYHSILVNVDKGLCNLAVELYEKAKGTEIEAQYFQPAFIAKLLTEEDCSAWLREQMKKRVFMDYSSDKKSQSVISYLERYLTVLQWDPIRKEYVISMGITDPVYGKYQTVCQSVKQRIPGAFTELIMELGSINLDRVLSNCLNIEDKEYSDKLLDYFYKRALIVQNNRMYCSILKEHGYPFCENLAVNYFKRKGVVDRWELTWQIDTLPGSSEEKIKEFERVCELMKSGKLKKRNITDEWLEQYRQQVKFG